MRAGLLRHRIEIQEQTDVPDGIGGFTTTWSTLYYARASIWPLSSRERLDAMKQELEITHKIRMRFRDDIKTTSKNRIKFGDRIFNMTSRFVPDERRIMIDMLAVEDI